MAKDFSSLRKLVIAKLNAELAPELTYHCTEHTIDVERVAIELCKTEGISDENQILLLRTAALLHDSGYTLNFNNHEEKSCVLASELLPRFGYSAEEIDAICEMISATRIPQQPQNKLSEILCDADLDYLGREDFAEISDKLYKEFSWRGAVKTTEEWNGIQVAFFRQHSYFTASSQFARAEHKQKHLEELERI